MTSIHPFFEISKWFSANVLVKTLGVIYQYWDQWSYNTTPKNSASLEKHSSSARKINITLKRSCPFGLASLCYPPIKYEMSGADIKYAALQSEYANVESLFLMFESKANQIACWEACFNFLLEEPSSHSFFACPFYPSTLQIPLISQSWTWNNILD